MLDDHQDKNNTASEVESLIARCLRGEQVAYTQLYERFAAGTYRLCYSLVLNRQDAEDVVQEVFVYAFKSLHRFDANRASFKTWLYTITVSRCRNTYRRKRLPQVDITQVFRLDMVVPRSELPEVTMVQKDVQDELLAALAQLSPQLREAIVLRYGHGLIYREIAEVMDCPAKTAESRVRLAHNRLRSLLQPRGRALLEELLSF
jgi:RNA polymerase sigma-70 factor, ECF subfamily